MTLATYSSLQVVHMFSHRIVFSWAGLISGNSYGGMHQAAPKIYQGMGEEGVERKDHPFVSLLKPLGTPVEKGETVVAKKKLMSLEIGLHAGVQRIRFLNLHGKRGDILEAHNVYDGLFPRNVESWNAMLSAYVDQGGEEKALQLYWHMQKENVSPNKRTFVIALQACCMVAEKDEGVVVGGQLAKVISLEAGQALHADALWKGFDSCIFVSSTLISMYGKCGSIVEAESVFIGLSKRDVVSWTALLSAYVVLREAEKALQLYKQMQQDGVNPNERTFVMALKACSLLAEKEKSITWEGLLTKLTSLQIGRALHADTQRKDFESYAFLCSALVSMYGKCGSMVDAEKVFCGVSLRDIVSWNAMLSAYVEHGEGGKALLLYRKLQNEGVSANKRTFVIAIQACCTLAEKEKPVVVEGWWTKGMSLETGHALHADALRMGFSSLCLHLGGSLVSMYGKCGSILEAEHVFSSFAQCNIGLWNAMLLSYAEQGEGEKALYLYMQMKEEVVSMDSWTFVIILQACCVLEEKEGSIFSKGRLVQEVCLEIGRILHADAVEKCLESYVCVGNTLISMYGKCGAIMEAEKVFSVLSPWNAASWSAMLSVYAEQGEGEKALCLCRHMQDEGAIVDDVTLVCVLQVCSETGSMETCRQVHQLIVCFGYDSSHPLLNTLVHAYGSCSSMVDAQAVFKSQLAPDVISWTALIDGYAREGNFVASLQSFEEMQLAGIWPDGAVFVSLLSTCSHAGLVDKGVEFFDSMRNYYGISPKVEHYGSIVDLLGRAGDFMKVEDILWKMPMHPDLAMWLSVLRACQMHGNVELGKLAFDCAVHSHPKQAAAYVLLSNIYGDTGMRYLYTESAIDKAWP